ncbi:structural maintenance of chromosomes protein 6-like [Limulus polyphemus]|uniref:Structural maintenance of chromosomes protein 6-like n=1 Tax=Limulus polyphemus TaxID=6850 RepID=A0ABM1TNE5_LIMPO|nr:structural maintenance of chromosomes protein 6-like [Limulus polyphemus]
MAGSRKRQSSSPDVPGNKRSRQVSPSETVTVPLTRNPQLSKTEEEAEVGIIESISLKNFMCHGCLDFRFGPNVNIIIGHNGSGKSAILTALVIGLGGKAHATNRGSNIKGFIKTGKLSAEIIVKLRNRGVDAHKPEEYGSTITIERRITSDGTSTYKMKGELGNLVSSKREELVHILDQFNIQVDNPVAVLNQEVSRKFLSSKNDHDIFQFFLKATQLGQMCHDYDTADEQKIITIDILSIKEENFKVLEKEVKEWEKKWQFHQSLDQQRQKIDKLKKEIAWAYITELERNVEELLKTFTREDRSTPKYEEKVQEQESKLNKISHRRERELKAIENEMHAVKKEKEGLIIKIEELRKAGPVDYVAQREERLRKMQLLEDEKQRLHSQLSTSKLHLEQLKKSVLHYAEKEDNIQTEKQGLEMEYRALNRKVQDLEASRGNQLRMFGTQVPELITKINEAYQQGKFKKKPRGPVGSCIHLKDPNWALAVETCLKSLMFAFCCDNHHDEKVLQDLINRVLVDGRKPQIICATFQEKLYDVVDYAVQSTEFRSVLEILSVKDPVIVNCLIDQRMIECVLLIPDKEQARQVMLNNVPKNCREAFTIEGDQLYPSPSFRYYSSLKHRASLLQGNVEEEIKVKKQEAKSVQSQIQEMQRNFQETSEQKQSNEREMRNADTHVAKINQSIARTNLEINDLRNTEEPDPVNVSALDDEVSFLNQKLEKYQAEQQKKKEVVEEAFQELKQVDDRCQSLDVKIKSLLNETHPVKEKLNQIDSEIEQLKASRRHYQDKLKKHAETVARMKREFEIAKKDCEDVCKDVITGCVHKDVITGCVHKDVITGHGNKEEVTVQYYETKQKYEKIQLEMKKMKKFMEALDEGIRKRKKAYRIFRQQLCLRIKYLFITALSQRNYDGKISFDHKEETLKIEVRTNETVKEYNSDLKSLSGGERSFATVCFLLALWDAVESPFRILDEFDVFMDMANRRVSMDMMLDTALHKLRHQFIFLTPQDMTKIRASPRIRICRMPDPDRRQSTLPFSKQVVNS